MQAAILVIGDEILNGDTLDTNSNFAAKLLWAAGIKVGNILVVADTEDSIREGLQLLYPLYDLVITTGGLGPTKDDVTKNTISSFFNSELIFDEQIYENLKERFAKRGLQMSESNKVQAMVPDKAEVIQNPVGTAPVLWFDINDKIVVCLPGVPMEMRFLLENVLLNRIKEKFNPAFNYKKNVLTVGIPESSLSEKLKDVEAKIENEICNTESYKLAYLPKLGEVRLQISGSGDDPSLIRHKVDSFQKMVVEAAGEYVYGQEADTLWGSIGVLLKERDATLSTAESCTGGYLAHLITSSNGSSDYYQGTIVAYQNEVKMVKLNVKKATLESYGAVSKAVVTEMVNGCLEAFDTDFALATTGYAGLEAGDNSESGLVWIAVSNKFNTIAKSFKFNRDKGDNIHLFSITALDMLRRFILGYKI